MEKKVIIMRIILKNNINTHPILPNSTPERSVTLIVNESEAIFHVFHL